MRERALKAGADSFARKPFDPFELVGLLARLLSTKLGTAVTQAAA